MGVRSALPIATCDTHTPSAASTSRTARRLIPSARSSRIREIRPDATPDVKVSRALCLEHQPTAWSKASEQSSASNSINVNPYCAPPSAGHPERWGSGLATRTACDVGCAVYFSQRVYAGTLHTPLSQRPRMNCTRVYAGTLHTPACMVRQRDDYLQLNHRFRAGV